MTKVKRIPSCFTYLFLKNGEMRYKCTIIDLHDRSVVASITDRHITSGLESAPCKKPWIHSQGPKKGWFCTATGDPVYVQAFVEFCESAHVAQSMSKAGYPYDNAPMDIALMFATIPRSDSSFVILVISSLAAFSVKVAMQMLSGFTPPSPQ